jgi:hypothetical protein
MNIFLSALFVGDIDEKDPLKAIIQTTACGESARVDMHGQKFAFFENAKEMLEERRQ